MRAGCFLAATESKFGAGADGYTFDIEWRGSGTWGGSGNSNSGWGNSGGSGWGNNSGTGWNNTWGNNFTYRGSGSGNFSHSNGQRQDIRGAVVSMDRNTNIVQVYFNANFGQDSRRFNGHIQRIERDTVTVTIQRARNRGEKVSASTTIDLGISGDRRVRWINSDGDAAGGRF
ncbi:MAG: hypothetical protein HY821_00095 [Acidobacteria bacterium]|nr:hypothetical protein [Acidobacteriota bacterium]